MPPRYLVPDDPVGEEAFSVIRDAMQATGMAGISRLFHRERAAMLEPRDRGIVLWTLRYGEEVRDLTSLVRLPYLAPDIVRALLKGRQPIELTPTRLLRLS